MPLIIVQRGSLRNLVAYETALALAAVISMLCFAPRVESMRRSAALKLGCIVILLTGALRYIFVSFSYSLHALILIDVIAVSAFGFIQPVFGTYPAETVEKYRMEQAFRIRRIVITLGSLIGPLLAGAAIAFFSLKKSLLIAVIVSTIALIFAMTLPKSATSNKPSRKLLVERIQDMFLGIKLKLTLPPERFLTVSGVLFNLVATATLPVLVPYLIHARNLASSSAGLFNAIFASGAIGGLLFLSPVIAKKNKQRNKYLGLWALLTVGLCGCSYSLEVWKLALSLFVVGAAGACISLVGVDKRAASIPCGVRIRLTAATLVVSQLANSASYMIAGSIMPKFGAQGLSWLYLATFISVAIYAMLSKNVWRFLEDEADTELYYPKNYPKLAARMRL